MRRSDKRWLVKPHCSGKDALRVVQIEGSGLSLHAFDDFDEAAMKVIELARKST